MITPDTNDPNRRPRRRLSRKARLYIAAGAVGTVALGVTVAFPPIGTPLIAGTGAAAIVIARMEE